MVDRKAMATAGKPQSSWARPCSSPASRTSADPSVARRKQGRLSHESRHRDTAARIQPERHAGGMVRGVPAARRGTGSSKVIRQGARIQKPCPQRCPRITNEARSTEALEAVEFAPYTAPKPAAAAPNIGDWRKVEARCSAGKKRGMTLSPEEGRRTGRRSSESARLTEAVVT